MVLLINPVCAGCGKLSRIDRFSLGPIGDSKRGHDSSRGGRGSS